MNYTAHINLKYIGIGLTIDKYGLQFGITIGEKIVRIWQGELNIADAAEDEVQI